MAVSTITKRKAERLEARIRELLRERDHAEGCPAERLEAFGARRPPQADSDGRVLEPAREVTVVRCIDCAGSRVVDEPYDQAIAAAVAAEED